MPTARLLMSSIPTTHCFVYTDFSKFSPGMLFQELSSNYCLRFVLGFRFAKCNVSVNYKRNAFWYMDCWTPEGVKLLNLAVVNQLLGFWNAPIKTWNGKKKKKSNIYHWMLKASRDLRAVHMVIDFMRVEYFSLFFGKSKNAAEVKWWLLFWRKFPICSSCFLLQVSMCSDGSRKEEIPLFFL